MISFESLALATGMAGLFASRAFLPAFLAACSMRWGSAMPMINQLDFFQAYQAAPEWFTSDWTLAVLGCLAALEVSAQKVPEAEQALGYINQYMKPAMAAAGTFGILSAEDMSFLEGQLQAAGLIEPVVSGFAAGLTYFLSAQREAFLGFFREADDGDDTGIRGTFSWVEDISVLLGWFVLIVFPLLIVIILAIEFGFIAWMVRRARVREEQRKVACGKCGAMVYASAPHCPSCGTVREPNGVGFWGQSLETPAGDPHEHRLHLVEKKRCSHCATPFKGSMQESCEACGTGFFRDNAFALEYAGRIDGRLFPTLVISFLVGLIPVAGLVIGVIFYRIQLVAPYRRYLGAWGNWFTRWSLRIFFLFLMLFQILPLLGELVIPLMAFINHRVYRKKFIRLCEKKIPAAATPGP